jgi:hypothetical protein
MSMFAPLILLHVTGKHRIWARVEAATAELGHCAGVADHARHRDRRDVSTPFWSDAMSTVEEYHKSA